MAELDYAFLADFATIQEGRLTAVGASFTHAFIPQLPAVLDFAVAGRVRVREDEDPPELELQFKAAQSNVNLTVTGTIEPSPHSRPYDGKVGILFTLAAGIQLLSEELVTVEVHVNGAFARRLAFQVSTTSGMGDE